MTRPMNALAWPLCLMLASGLPLAGCGESGGAAHSHDGDDHTHDDHSHDEQATAVDADGPRDDGQASGDPVSDEQALDEQASGDDAASELGLAVGATAPDATLLDAEGNEVSLASLYADGPVVVVFYRGGWCPFCNESLKAWQGELASLTEAGGTLVAVSPEKPGETANTIEKNNASFLILSDATFEAANAFGLRFSLDDATIEAYEGYGIDLADHNASAAWDLPHPGTFVIDTEGVVRWKSASEDYRTRPAPGEVIAAVREI